MGSLGSLGRGILIAVWALGLGVGGLGTTLFLGLQRSPFPVFRAQESAPGGWAFANSGESGGEKPPDEREERDWGPSVPEDVARTLRVDPLKVRPEDRRRVLEYLRQEASAPVTSSDSSTETREADASWIADAALTWLRRGWADADELAWELMGLARTQTAASGVREAALMHLGFCQVGAPMRQRIGSQLCALAAEPASFAWVGLALRLLGREVFVAEQPEWVRERCMELAADPQAHVLCRITAFDLAARRGWHEAEPLARLQAVSAPATGERVSALHVLAEVGNEDTLRWLEKWEPPADPFVAACLDATRERLRARGTTF